jgi:hypothetical protein
MKLLHFQENRQRKQLLREFCKAKRLAAVRHVPWRIHSYFSKRNTDFGGKRETAAARPMRPGRERDTRKKTCPKILFWSEASPFWEISSAGQSNKN